jgi:hypothetical protein
MAAKGPQPGATFKADALALLPEGANCQRLSRMGITGYVICLPDGRQIASAGNAGLAWRAAYAWALDSQPKGDAS